MKNNLNVLYLNLPIFSITFGTIEFTAFLQILVINKNCKIITQYITMYFLRYYKFLFRY